MRQNSTERILAASRQEFAKKGFRDASLRVIAQQAGVTTGAVYAHYPDKEAIFAALVEPVAGEFLQQFEETQLQFAEMPLEEQVENMFSYTDKTMCSYLDIIYGHFDQFYLLLCCSAGTTYENYLHTLIEIEAESTRRFMRSLEECGRVYGEISDELVHILAQALFTSIFECVVHNMKKSEASHYVKGLSTFFYNGWKALLGW